MATKGLAFPTWITNTASQLKNGAREPKNSEARRKHIADSPKSTLSEKDKR
jgi:hypothetical protein